MGIYRTVFLVILLIIGIVLGNWLPLLLFTENIQVMQILCTILFISPFIYGVFKWNTINDSLYKQLTKCKSISNITLNLCDDFIENSFSKHIYDDILEDILHLLNADRGCIAAVNKNKEVEYQALHGYGEDEKVDVKFPVINGDIGSGNPKTQLYTPLSLKDRVIGYLYIERKDGKGFETEDIQIMQYFGELSSKVIHIYDLMDNISRLARYDDLTNTFNRRHFIELFSNTCLNTYKTGESFSLVYFDIDNLKITNDQFGHHYGDQVITTFSKVIQDNIRESDLFSRFGGDEFIAVLYHANEDLIRKRIQNIARQLRENPIITHNGKIFVEFSFGIANYPEDAIELNDLIQVADQRMYFHKAHMNNGAS